MKSFNFFNNFLGSCNERCLRACTRRSKGQVHCVISWGFSPVMMKPLIFFGYKVNEDPQDFHDAIYKILYAMRVIFNEKYELAAYKLKIWLKLCILNEGTELM